MGGPAVCIWREGAAAGCRTIESRQVGMPEGICVRYTIKVFTNEQVSNIISLHF
jgi:hypothetical protein